MTNPTDIVGCHYCQNERCVDQSNPYAPQFNLEMHYQCPYCRSYWSKSQASSTDAVGSPSAGEGKYVGNQVSTPSPAVQTDVICLTKNLCEQVNALSQNQVTKGRAVLLKIGNAFPAIANALLDREEKLKIAVEALEHISVYSDLGGKTAGEALGRIRSLPSE